MTLPNAYKGVKKLFIAEILQLIGIALILIAMVFLGAARAAYTTEGLTGATEGLALSGLLPLFGGLLLPLIAFILSLVGLRQASKDEHDHMNKAFWCAICGLILSIIASTLQGLHLGGGSVFNFIATILEMCMIIFSIMGVSEVTQNIARQDVADMGPKILTFAVIAIVASLIARITGAFIGGIAVTISIVFMLAAYVVYLVFLGKATSALAKG